MIKINLIKPKNAITFETCFFLVTFFSNYFEAKESTGRVDILSNRNDTKLATYGVWGGLKILK